MSRPAHAIANDLAAALTEVRVASERLDRAAHAALVTLTVMDREREVARRLGEHMDRACKLFGGTR